MSKAMTVIQAKVETKLKYVSTARKRQKCRGTMYTSEGSDWSTGINICSGLLGLRLNIQNFPFPHSPLSLSVISPLRQANARSREADRQTTFFPGKLRSSGRAE